MKKVLFSVLFALAVPVIHPLSAQTRTDSLVYAKQEMMIPMRDGIRLHAVVYTPAGVTEPLPLLILRTPYGADKFVSPALTPYISDMARDGYIFVFQDLRGRYKSEGTFHLQDLYRENKGKNEADESTDAYDTIDWLLKNIPGNNGKAGVYGISAVGSTTLLATIDPHPALKAASEQAAGFVNLFLVDDFYHNGAFRLSYSFEYAYLVESAKENAQFPFDQYDTYDWFLKIGPLSHVNKDYFHNRLGSWNNYTLHTTLDDFWQKQSLVHYLDTPKVPILHVAGYWDQEDLCGPLIAYEVLEKNDRDGQNIISIGPWNHGGWRIGPGESLGNVGFGRPTGEEFRRDIQAPFFAYYLKNKGNGHFPEAVTFQTGSNAWVNYDQWPPVNLTINKNLYFRSNGELSFDPPDDPKASDTYLSDPMHPVPYRQRPIESTYGPGSRWETWLLEDQRFVHNRPDVMSWESEVLTDDLAVTGNPLADLFASTTGTDADWIVKLIDVYPENFPEKPEMGGYQLMVANDVLRGRFRNGFSKPEPVRPDEIQEYRIDLHAVNHVFLKGHRIMIQVQSTWFPIIDRNPQKYIPNIFEAQQSDFTTAYQSIHRSAKYPSHIVLPIVE